MIRWSVWNVKSGRKGWAKYHGPMSYQDADVLKVALMEANQDDNVFLFIVKERASK